LLKFQCLCNSFFCVNLLKIFLKIYYTCEPFLFMKNDNCVDKEYEEANERGIAMKGWRCTLCWSWKIISHYGERRPCYPTSGRATIGRNQHWKRRIKNRNSHQNSLDGAIGRDYRCGTFVRPYLDPYQK